MTDQKLVTHNCSLTIMTDQRKVFSPYYKEKDKNINLLGNKFAAIENNVTNQNFYTSEDCIIIEKLTTNLQGLPNFGKTERLKLVPAAL